MFMKNKLLMHLALQGRIKMQDNCVEDKNG